MSLADDLFEQAFDPLKHRNPRSPEYRAGVKAMLQRRASGDTSGRLISPYQVGTAQADAWFAGADEGLRIWANHQDSIATPSKGDTP